MGFSFGGGGHTGSEGSFGGSRSRAGEREGAFLCETERGSYSWGWEKPRGHEPKYTPVLSPLWGGGGVERIFGI